MFLVFLWGIPSRIWENDQEHLLAYWAGTFVNGWVRNRLNIAHKLLWWSWAVHQKLLVLQQDLRFSDHNRAATTWPVRFGLVDVLQKGCLYFTFVPHHHLGVEAACHTAGWTCRPNAAGRIRLYRGVDALPLTAFTARSKPGAQSTSLHVALTMWPLHCGAAWDRKSVV